jgi:UDP-2,4-diacetamido-2,4,6-trideoxy-beta-L-altropyranose hydrolase
MRFVIRADASRKNGAGHVLRSSVLAQELIDRGYSVVFLGDTSELPWVSDYVSNLGFTSVSLPNNAFKSEPMTDYLILDSYSIDTFDPLIFQENWQRILVLVDEVTPKYLGDMYVHPGIHTTWTPPINLSFCELLMGAEYLLIRKSIRQIVKENSPETKRGLRLLITAGGSDPFNFCEQVVRILERSSVSFEAFILASNFELPAGDMRFKFVPLGGQYEELLGNIDWVFSTAGTSSWEFQYLGISIALAKAVTNQNESYQFQIQNNLASDFGYRDLSGNWMLDETLVDQIIRIESNKIAVPTRTQTLIDGQGAKRIIDKFLQS